MPEWPSAIRRHADHADDWRRRFFGAAYSGLRAEMVQELEAMVMPSAVA
jgi:hypothetical protein